MAKYQNSRVVNSSTLEGAKIIIWKMTEGRRLELRKTLTQDNARIRTIVREQEIIMRQPDDTRDNARWWELADEADQITLEKINPAYVKWGVKAVENVQVGDDLLTIEDWMRWPSMFFNEVIQLVKEESELNGAERKNLPSRTTSGEQADGSRRSSTADNANGKATTEAGTVDSTS